MDVDRLTAEELRALDSGQQVLALNILFREIKRLSDLKNDAIDALSNATILALEKPTGEAKANKIRAKAMVDKIGVMIAARKEQVKILQTQLRLPA